VTLLVISAVPGDERSSKGREDALSGRIWGREVKPAAAESRSPPAYDLPQLNSRSRSARGRNRTNTSATVHSCPELLRNKLVPALSILRKLQSIGSTCKSKEEPPPLGATVQGASHLPRATSPSWLVLPPVSFFIGTRFVAEPRQCSPASRLHGLGHIEPLFLFLAILSILHSGFPEENGIIVCLKIN